MPEELQNHSVEVTFVGQPPARQIAPASGVAAVDVRGSLLSCVVLGSFQPFLDALRGYEVMSLTSIRCRAGSEVVDGLRSTSLEARISRRSSRR